MAINKAMLAALKTLSSPDIDIKKAYKLQRKVIDITAKRFQLLPFHRQDLQIPVGDHFVPIRAFFPTQEQELRPPVILFLHGGGWVTGNVNSYDRVCGTLSRTFHRVVLSVDYRLAPEYRFPAGLEDCYAVARSLLLQGIPFSVQPDELILMGDSAGGNLAAAVSQMARDRGEFAIRQQILLYPATGNDHTKTSPFPSVIENGTDYLLTSRRICDYMELYVSSPEDYQNPYFAPLLAKDLSNQPRTLIVTAEFDPLRDEGEAYGKKLAEAGNSVQIERIPDALHGFFSLTNRFEPVRRCNDILTEFLKEGTSL